MVFINDQKYACVSCIKGHRSSSCAHSDRPLVAIKKKGRPVTQCEKCRELRKTKKIHVRCTCDDPQGSSVIGQATGLNKKGKKRPTTPTLPAGLKDHVSSIQPASPAHPKQRVDSLLNPCTCKSARSCKCNSPAASYSIVGVSASVENETLGSCCRPRSSALRALPFSNRNSENTRMKPYARQRFDNTSSTTRYDEPLSPTTSSDDYTLAPFRIQHVNDSLRPVLPGVESICTCGPSCACLGCREHRGSTAVGEDCPDGCDHCVDHRLLSLPASSSVASFTSLAFQPLSSTSLSMERLLPAVPPPPRSRLHKGIQLDPTNVTVYTSSVLSNAEAARAVGLVKLPPLVCCSGQCSCPADACACGTKCVGARGCAASHRAPQQRGPAETRSCCAADEGAVASLPSPPADVDEDEDGEAEILSPRPITAMGTQLGAGCDTENVDVRMASPAPSTTSSLQTAPGSPDPDYFPIASCCA